jgi:hypothetical protein
MLLQDSVRRMNRNVIPSSAFVILYYMDFLLKCNFHSGIFFRFIFTPEADTGLNRLWNGCPPPMS